MGVQKPLSTMQGGLVCLLLLLCVLLQHSASKSLDSGAPTECSGPPGCPHVCFEQKHYCEGCITKELAEDKCAGREPYTKENKVFYGAIRFEERDEGIDQNGNPWTETRAYGEGLCTNNHAVSNG